MSTQTESAFYLPNKLRRCGRYESIFYGAYAGEGATFDIRVRFDFKQKVNLPRFQAAANKALEAYPEFAVRPVLYQGRVCYEENHASVALLPDNGVQRCFGTEDTNGYLFLFLYGERHVTFSLFHSQTDAHGLICYVITVMWRYLTNLFPPARLAGANLLNRGGVRTDSSRFNDMQDTERFDPLTAFARPGKLEQPVDLERLFRLPPETAPKGAASCRLVNLEISNAAFLQKVKALHTSFAPLLAALTAEAIRDCYDVGDRDVVIITTADARRVIQTNTLANLSYNLLLPLTPADMQRPLEEQCAVLQAHMKRQRTQTHIRATFQDILRQCDEIDAMGDVDEVNRMLTGPNGLANALTGSGTVFLTYPGRIDNNPISRMLLEGISPGMLAAERAVVVYAHRDSLIIQLTQKSDDPAPVNAMRRTLERHGFSPKVRDLGRVTQNIFDFDKIKRI